MAININIKYGTGIKVFLCMFFLLIMLFLTACKSTRTVSSVDIKTDSLEKMDVTSKVESTVEAEKEVTVSDHSIINNALNETITDLLWSAPDSSGKQHIVRETITVRSGNTIKSSNVTKIENNKESQKTESMVVDKTKKRSTIKTDVDVKQKTKIKSPVAFTAGILIIVSSVIVFVFLFLKSKKII